MLGILSDFIFTMQKFKQDSYRLLPFFQIIFLFKMLKHLSCFDIVFRPHLIHVVSLIAINSISVVNIVVKAMSADDHSWLLAFCPVRCRYLLICIIICRPIGWISNLTIENTWRFKVNDYVGVSSKSNTPNSNLNI